MTTRAMTLLLLFCVTASAVGQPWTTKDLSGLETYRLTNGQPAYKDIVAILGDLFIAYRYGGITFENGIGEYINAFDYAFIFAKKDNQIQILGKIDKLHVYDAFGNVIVDVAQEDPSLAPDVLGISSSILQRPGVLNLVAKMSYSTVDHPVPFETELVAMLSYDTQRKTITRWIPY